MNRLLNNFVRWLKSDQVRRLGIKTQEPSVRRLIMGIIAVLAFLMLIIFAILNWYSLSNAQIRYSALEIIFSNDEASNGFGRGIDLFLSIIPLGCFILILLTVMVFTDRLPYAFAINSAVSIVFIILSTIWVWRDLSIDAWYDLYSEQTVANLRKGYQLVLPTLLAVMMLFITMLGWALFYGWQLGFFSEVESETAELPNKQ